MEEVSICVYGSEHQGRRSATSDALAIPPSPLDGQEWCRKRITLLLRMQARRQPNATDH